ncbi:transketolase family protein [bacterium]|jgi:transketolase|nr:transketolase family protein [bacterium]
MSKATRQAFGEALAQLGETHSEIVVLDADLSKSTKSDLFAKKFPHRFYEMGIAEANMIGTAAGLSFTGKLPFLCSFGCFLTGRYDTIRLSVAYSQANVRLIGTHAGVGIGDDGHSQMGLEDIALMRALPTMGVFQPMDAQETQHLMNYLVKEWKGPAYLRLTRQNLPDLYPAGKPFRPGKLMEITSFGEDSSVQVACIATGASVSEAMEASKKLQEKGIQMSVWNAHSLKPFDAETTLKIAKNSCLMLTVEDHSVIGGLGSCVSEALSSVTQHPKLIRLGVQDLFGESGEPVELYEKFGISANAISQQVLVHLKG